MMENIPLIAAGAGVVGLLIAFYLYNQVTKVKIDNEVVADITDEIQKGAMAFLFAEYRILSIFVVVVGAILAYLNDFETAIAFFAGAIASVLAGFSGMRSATSANGRTAMAAKNDGQAGALAVSYNGGAVMGLSVGGLGLLGISLIAFWLSAGETVSDGTKMNPVSAAAGFGMGASSIALFARVGGGIYTKAADVGADLVGKVEAGIPEDDPRNPAVIADNVGDNVGDVAGMGADIFESFVGSIIAAMIIANDFSPDTAADYVLLPILLGFIGYAASIIGVFSMSFLKNGNDPAAALREDDRLLHDRLDGYPADRHHALPLLGLRRLPRGQRVPRQHDGGRDGLGHAGLARRLGVVPVGRCCRHGELDAHRHRASGAAP